MLVKKVNGQSVAEPPCFPISPLESFAPLEALSRSGQSKSLKSEKNVGKGSKLAESRK